MEKQSLFESCGYFPADLMACIANYASVHTVTAILLTNKYWNKILSPLLVHPAVTIIIRSERNFTRSLYHFQRGRGYHLWSKDVEDGVYPREHRQDSQAYLGYFNSLIDMRNFLEELRSIMTDPNPQADIQESSYFQDYYGIIGTSIGDMQCYNMKIPVEADQAEIDRAKKRSRLLRKFLASSAYITLEHVYDIDHMDIYIYIMNRAKDFRQELSMTVLENGDVICSIEGEVFREYRVRNSPKLFENLVEIVKYSKHKRQLRILDDENPNLKTVYAFALTYKPLSTNHMEGDNNSHSSEGDEKVTEGYYIVHEVKLNLETNRHIVDNNGYKTGALAKVVNLLENTLFNPKLAGPTLIREKHLSFPPQSKGIALFDSVRFDPKLRSVGIPNLLAIVLHLNFKENRDHMDEYIISVDTQESLEDLKETLRFFTEVEDALQVPDQKEYKPMYYVLNKKYSILTSSVKIYTYSPEPITKVSQPILDLIAKRWLKVFPWIQSEQRAPTND